MKHTIERVLWPLIFEATGLSLTFILWFLQENRQQESAESGNANNTVLWGCIAFVVILIINTCIIFRNEMLYKQRVIDDWSSMLLQHIIDDNLAGENYTVRASIYRPAGFFKALFIYLRYPWHILSSYWWSNLPHDRNASYLYLYSRKSTVQENSYGTMIKATSKEEKSNGVVDFCYKHKNDHNPVYVTTTPIHDVKDLTEEALLANHVHTDKLIKYMNDTCIESQNFNLLRSMKTHPHLLYAIKLNDNKENIWGVLVIDTDDVNYQKSIEDEMSGVYSHYSKLFKNLFNSL